MKLFLASAFDQVASLLEKKLQKNIKGNKVIFIANPADNHQGDKWWVKIDHDAYEDLGCEVIDTDLRTVPLDDFEKLLETSDIIHICGGSVFYALGLMREKGFDGLIVDSVRKEKIVYAGTSAGSMIVAGDLSLDAQDPDEKQFVEKMTDFSGLGLVDFLIMPHANNADFAAGNLEAVKLLPKYSQPLIFLYDNQAVWVGENKFEILSI